MTMQLRITNLGPAQYTAEVSQGQRKVAVVGPGETKSVYLHKGDGGLGIVEVDTPKDFELNQSPPLTSNYVDGNGNPTGGHVLGVGLEIAWQNGPLGRGDERKAPNGAFVEDVIAAAMQRLAFYQASQFACKENAAALLSLGEALEFLQARTARREADLTEGTHSGS